MDSELEKNFSILIFLLGQNPHSGQAWPAPTAAQPQA
jgi:hypothetical protein